ncbi:MAG: cytochrome c-type biogenesis protein CcmH, partial [Gemmatimonadaceae bacterium]|nr:cytochrome c-type biogenesis protein CcmH [Gemmatimonadaceae bacterium]
QLFASRREFLRAGAALTAGALLAPRLRAQDAQSAAAGQQGAANIEMPQTAYKPVTLPKKPNAKPLVAQLQRDELERGLKCACPCKLDVFTCRTTDFQCGISPAMHSDVVRLIDGGYSADEIVAAFTTVYGERVLMAPVKEGFNIAGYVVPFITLGIGATMLVALLRRWKRETESAAPAVAAKSVLPIGGGVPEATDDEMRRLQAAVRGEAVR